MLYPSDTNYNAGRSPFLKCRVTGDYEKCYDLCVELKKLTNKLKSIIEQNVLLAEQCNDENPPRVMKKIPKFPRCCCCAKKTDEEEWMRQKI